MRELFRVSLMEIDERRRLLVARSQAQRLELADHCREFERPLRWISAVLRVAEEVRARPVLAAAAAAAAALAAIGLSRWREWVLRALSVYQLGRFLQSRLGRPSTAG